MSDADQLLQNLDHYVESIRVVRKSRQKYVANIRELEDLDEELTDEQKAKLDKVRAEFAELALEVSMVRMWNGPLLRFFVVEEEPTEDELMTVYGEKTDDYE